MQACSCVFVTGLKTAVPGSTRCSGPVVTPRFPQRPSSFSQDTSRTPFLLTLPLSLQQHPKSLQVEDSLCSPVALLPLAPFSCQISHSTGPSTSQFPDIRLIKNVGSHEDHQREITLPIFCYHLHGSSSVKLGKKYLLQVSKKNSTQLLVKK